MSENSSSASHEKIMPAGKPSASFVAEPGLGSIPGNEGVSIGSTEKSSVTESFAKGDVSFDGATAVTPQGEPSSTFINTSAVK